MKSSTKLPRIIHKEVDLRIPNLPWVRMFLVQGDVVLEHVAGKLRVASGHKRSRLSEAAATLDLQNVEGMSPASFILFPELFLPFGRNGNYLDRFVHQVGERCSNNTVILVGLEHMSVEEYLDYFGLQKWLADDSGLVSLQGARHKHQPLNCLLILVKDNRGILQGFTQLKIRASVFEESASAGSEMLPGQWVYLLSTESMEGFGSVTFLALICYDYIAQLTPRETALGLVKSAGLRLLQSREIDLLMVPQCNPEPSHPSFALASASFFGSKPLIQNTCVVLLNGSERSRVLGQQAQFPREPIHGFGHSAVLMHAVKRLHSPKFPLSFREFRTEPYFPGLVDQVQFSGDSMCLAIDLLLPRFREVKVTQPRVPLVVETLRWHKRSRSWKALAPSPWRSIDEGLVVRRVYDHVRSSRSRRDFRTARSLVNAGKEMGLDSNWIRFLEAYLSEKLGHKGRGRRLRAERIYEELFTDSQLEPELRVLVAMRLAALTSIGLDRADRSLAVLTEAEDLIELGGLSKEIEAQVYYERGETLRHVRHFAEALQAYKQARTLSRSTEFRALVDHHEAVVTMLLGEPCRAERLLLSSLEVFEKRENNFRMANILRDLGIVSLRRYLLGHDMAHLHGARRFIESSIDSLQGVFDLSAEAASLARLGEILMYEGKLEEASSHLQKAQGLAARDRNRLYEAQVLTLLVRLCYLRAKTGMSTERGEVVGAVAHTNQLADLAQQDPHINKYVGRSSFWVGLMKLYSGDPLGVVESIQKAVRILREDVEGIRWIRNVLELEFEDDPSILSKLRDDVIEPLIGAIPAQEVLDIVTRVSRMLISSESEDLLSSQ